MLLSWWYTKTGMPSPLSSFLPHAFFLPSSSSSYFRFFILSSFSLPSFALENCLHLLFFPLSLFSLLLISILVLDHGSWKLQSELLLLYWFVKDFSLIEDVEAHKILSLSDSQLRLFLKEILKFLCGSELLWGGGFIYKGREILKKICVGHELIFQLRNN